MSFIASLRRGSNGSDHGSEMAALQRELLSAQRPAGTCGGNTFLPYSVLEEKINTQVVTKVLSRKFNSPETVSKLASFVCGKPGAKRVFSILVCINHTEVIGVIDLFYKYNFVDSILPVHIDQSGKVQTHSKDKKDSEITEKVFSDEFWEVKMSPWIFHDYQWQFLGPIFNERQFRYSFRDEHRMPFLGHPGGPRDSHFSMVEKWSIHKSHFKKSTRLRLSIDTDGHPIVAVKELKKLNMTGAEYGRAAEVEAEVLQMIREMEHPHLIKAIASYEKGDRYFIVLPWARGGNLRDYWGREPPRKLDGDFVGWALGQFCGLAGAMKKLHSANDSACRHGDLKPENILCFEDSKSHDPFLQPFLVIADVGLARVHTLATGMRNDISTRLHGTGVYEPPEAVLSQVPKRQPRSRRYDIWSIGCIYFEFMIWLLYGQGGRVRFEDDTRDPITGRRSFYEVNGSGLAEFKPIVYKWIDWVRKDPRCPEDTAVRMVLELIITRLLIIEVGEPKSSTFKHDSNAAQTTHHVNKDSGVQRATRFKMHSGLNDSNSYGLQGRATSTEMLQSLRNIQTAAIGLNPKLQWIYSQAQHPGLPPSSPEGFDDIQSVASAAPSLTAGSTASSAISQMLMNSIRKNIIDFLFQDDQMCSLLEATPKTMDVEKFERNFHRLFKGFIIELKTEFETLDSARLGVSKLEFRQVVRGLRSCSWWLARSLFKQLCQTSDEAQVLDEEMDPQTHIMRFLDDDSEVLLTKEELEVAPLPPIDSYHLSDSPQEDSSSEEDDPHEPSYEGMRHLLSQSRSFENFRNRYRDFISPQSILKVEKDDESTESVSTFIERSAGATWHHDAASWLRKLARPSVKKGYQRFEWICDCGEEIYADFDASNPDFLLNFQSFLTSQMSVSPDTRSPHQSIYSAETAIEGSSRMQVQTNHQPHTTAPMKPPPDEHSSKRQLKSDDQTTPQTSSAQRTTRFLELCVNTGGFEPHLTEIPTACVESDSQLFAKIRESYHDVRGFRNRLYLLKPVDVHFVKFSLEDRHRAGISDKPKALPDMNQMSIKGYHYSPYPAEFLPPMPTGTFLHYFYHKDPNAHPRLRWAHRIPQKLNTKIVDDADEFVVGWGIHIIEGVNRVDALLVTLLMLIVSSIIAIIWTLVKDDIQGGFGIGSWVLTFQTVVLMLVLAKWNEL